MSDVQNPHPSSLALARLLLGKASDEEVRGVESHAELCAQCRSALDRARHARLRFAESVLPRTLPAIEQRVARRRWIRFLPSLGFATAVAGVVLLLVVVHREPSFQTKGTGALKIFALRDNRVFSVDDGARLRPGDRIRFGVQPGGAGFVLVASIDGRGKVSLYQPSMRLTSRTDPIELLPDSIVLDDAPGPERIFAIFSDRRLEGEELSDALRMLAAAGTEAVRRTRRLPVPFAQATVLIEKSVDGR